jgi:hypothetical protein
LFVTSIDAEGILARLTGIEGPWIRRNAPEWVSDLAFYYTCDDKDGYVVVKDGILTVTVNGEVLYDSQYREDPVMEPYILVDPVETNIPMELAA